MSTVMPTQTPSNEQRTLDPDEFRDVIGHFASGVTVITAVQDGRDKVATIVSRFPRDTLPPEITKFDPDSAPILTLAISGNRTQKEITEIADKKIKLTGAQLGVDPGQFLLHIPDLLQAVGLAHRHLESKAKHLLLDFSHLRL